MATRYSRSGGGGPRPRRRWAVFSLAALAVLGGAVWIAPTVLVLTHLRDRPLQAAFAGIDGHVASRAATWNWLGGIDYRDVVLCDRSGRPVVLVRRLVIDRGLLALALDPDDLGTIRLIGGEALVEVRRGGSSIEDILAPWLAADSRSRAARPLSFELELVDSTIELVDLERRDAWRLAELIGAGTVRSDGTLAGWTVSGRAVHAMPSAANPAAPVAPVEPPGADVAGDAWGRAPRLDRTTIAAGATAMLSREGGWSVSSPDAASTATPRTLAVATSRLPLGLSSVLATRFDAAHVLDGLADVRLDIALPAGPDDAARIAGSVSGTQLAVCRADTLAEIVTLERCEMPLDVSLDGRMVTVRNLKATSPLFKAEASGRIRIPQGGSWEWAEALIGEEFALAADIDLAAASRAIPGGITVRPDVRVTAGQLQVAAAAHADGDDRVLEVRASSRDLAAVQSVVPPAGAPQTDGPQTERMLRWNEPFTAWLRGRRGPARGDRLRIEEARLSSPAADVSGSGTAESSTVQWTLDIDRLMAEAAEVLDLKGVKISGTARGKVDTTRVVATGVSTAKLSAIVSNFELVTAGRRAWRDKEIVLEAEGSGGMAGGAVLLDKAHAVLTASDDRLEMTLTGGALIDVAAGLGLPGGGPNAAPWVRAGPESQGIAADCSLEGDLARWQSRVANLPGAIDTGDLELAGTVQLAAALAARGDEWQITRAGGELEKLAVSFGGRRFAEPRLVATAAGLFNPAVGRFEISSAEVLTASLSLRTGGLAILPARQGRPALVDRLRGKVQWQADVARIEKWLVAADAAARWPAGGRVWGTIEMLETPAGLNVRVEATGNQLTLATAAAENRLWSEPNATIVLEVTQDGGADPAAAERLVVNRLALDSSTVAVAATGHVGERSSRRMVELDGTVSYDWELLSRLLTPWTGGRVRLAGGGARPFALRGPLVDPALVANRGRPAAEPLATPLPDAWRDGGGAGSDPAATIAVPVAASLEASLRGGDGAAGWLRSLSIDTSAAWSAAEIEEFQLDAGEMAVRLFEGQLALGPFDIGASGGRLRGSPWVKLLPAPGELIVPPGRVVDRVALSSRLCDRWVAWVAPLLGRSTSTAGQVSVEVAGARLPLGDPFGGELSGQVLFENLEVTPGPHMQPLANLIVKLQSLIDPRFAFGDKAVLMRVRQEPVRVKLADRRLWHEGLVMDMGQLSVRTGGSVGADGSLAMVTEVAFRGDIAGTAPVIGQLLRTPLAIPLRGTVNHPQFDARAIDTVLGRIVENTAEAVINDGLNRGLEAIFGNPPAAPPKQP